MAYREDRRGKEKKKPDKCRICGGERGYVGPMFIENFRFKAHEDCRKVMPEEFLLWFFGQEERNWG